jgi:hypothetical protein
MATSNTTSFNLNVDDAIEEAYERCGMRMTAGYQLSSGRPAQYYVERTNVPKIYVYPTPDKAYTFKYYRIRRIQDSGDYTNTLDVNFRFLPCLSAGLAYYLSLKFAPERTQVLKGFYEEEFARAAAEDRDTASVSFVPQVGS